jgi:hypothetical protein
MPNLRDKYHGLPASIPSQVSLGHGSSRHWFLKKSRP